MDGIISVIADVLFAKTARRFLGLFGIKAVPELAAVLIGLVLWAFVGAIIVDLLR